MATTERNVFGRRFEAGRGAVEYALVRTGLGYVVVRRDAAKYLDAPALVRLHTWGEYGGTAACRTAAAAHARELARKERRHEEPTEVVDTCDFCGGPMTADMKAASDYCDKTCAIEAENNQ